MSKRKHAISPKDLNKKDSGDKTVRVQLVSDKKISLADRINIFCAFLTLITVIISFMTILEMKKDRNAAYKPDILVNPENVSINWDENGYEEWINKLEDRNSAIINPDGSVEDSILFTFQKRPYYIYSLPLANIGVGSAKDISISWDEENTQRLIKCLTDCDSSKEKFCYVNDDFTCFYYDTHRVEVTNEEEVRYMYMLPAGETEEIYEIPFPEVYVLLINEIIKTGNYVNSEKNNGPFLFLNLHYTDAINNKRYEKKFYIGIVNIVNHFNEDGSGYAEYQIAPVEGL